MAQVTTASHPAGETHGSSHHVIPFQVYINVIVALLILTAVTVAVSRVDFGAFNTIIAMLIASIKAGLVLAYFMHLKYDDRLYVVTIGTGIFFLILMYLLCFVDIYTRVLEQNIL